jgi:hypothetical protein
LDIESLLSEHKITDRESFLGDLSNIICQFDTDIAIEVMEQFGKEGEDQAMAIKVNYGY